MATLQDEMDTIEGGTDYVPNSLIIKSFDNNGLTFKWLESNVSGTADRKQKFIELDESEATTIIKLLDRTAVSSIMISEAI